MQNFEFLASQEIFRLLQVFIVSLKEAKRTFLTPAKMTSMLFFSINHLLRPQESCMQNFRFLAGREVLRIEISSFCLLRFYCDVPTYCLMSCETYKISWLL